MQNKQLSQTTINKIYNYLLNEYGVETATNFDEAEDKAAFLVRNRETLETDPKWNRNFKIEDLLKSNKSAMENIYNTYSNIDDITPERMTQLTNAYDISKEDLKKYYDMRAEQSKAVQKYNEERWAEIDKARNEAQRAGSKSYYNTPIANEYARKAYIQGNKVAALAHEVAGKAAAVADFAPPPASYIGPVIRGVQRIVSKDSLDANDYKDMALDVGGASVGLVGKIPGAKEVLRGTTGKIANILSRSKNKKAQEIANVVNKKAIAEERELAKAELKRLSEVGNLDNLSNDQLIELYNTTTDQIIKSELSKVWKARQDVEHARVIASHPSVAGNSQAASKAADDVVIKAAEEEQAYMDALKRAADYQAELEAKSGKVAFNEYGDIPTAYHNVPLDVISEQYIRQTEPSFMAKAIGEGILGAGRKVGGQSVAHRQWNEIDYKPDYNEDKAIDELKRTYGPTFSINERPNTDDPLINKAYDEWYKDNQYNWDILNKLEVNKPKHRYPWER